MIWLFAAMAADPWSTTIDGVLDAVVILKLDRTRPFDGRPESSTEASGFIVDAERGILLTNRHVVTHGPTTAFGIFHSQEEVDMVPLYVDPVHDFGFFRYDPGALEHLSPPSLQLVPEGAKVGTEIRVIGNDAAEQLSILAGTISRLDRAAPGWDFNTFYLQAASSTSGGSSGSPVFDLAGNVIALNAGARTDAATSLFLPLPRVKVALEALQRGETPSRGTLQTMLSYETYEELGRLGLTAEREAEARSRWTGTGLLTVVRVNPEGPADGVLEEGDILWTLAGAPVHEFLGWEAVLDARVDQPLEVGVLRGGELLNLTVVPQNLHSLVPDAFFELGEGLMHPLGYTAAIQVPRAVRGVVVARAGRLLATAGVPSQAVLERVGDREIRTLTDAMEAFDAVPEGETVQVRWSPQDSPTEPSVTSVRMSRALWPAQHCVRQPNSTWLCTDRAPAPKATVRPPLAVNPHTLPRSRHARVAENLVEVTFRSLLNVDSNHGNARTSVGLILDRDGLVLTDRSVVPMTAGQVRVRVGDAPSIPARIEHIDPLHNVAFVRFDPAQLDVELEPAVLAEDGLVLGKKHTFVGLDPSGKAFSEPITPASLDGIALQLPSTPRWFEQDIDLVRYGTLDRNPRGGVVLDRRGRIQGLLRRFEQDAGGGFSSFAGLTDTHDAREALARYRAGVQQVSTLGIDLWNRPLVDAREDGLPDAVAQRLREHAPERPEVLQVSRIAGNAPARGQLEVGDQLIGVAGRTVTTFRELEEAVQQGGSPLELVRDGRTLSVDVPLLDLPVQGTERVVLWAGTLVQEAPPSVSVVAQTPDAGVYLAWYYGGSPAQRYNTGYGRRLVAIDGVEIHDLDGFLAAVRGKEHRDSVRLRLQGLDGTEWVSTLTLDLAFWPTTLFERVDGEWVRSLAPE